MKFKTQFLHGTSRISDAIEWQSWAAQIQWYRTFLLLHKILLEKIPNASEQEFLTRDDFPGMIIWRPSGHSLEGATGT